MFVILTHYHTRAMVYDEACFMHQPYGVVHNFLMDIIMVYLISVQYAPKIIDSHSKRAETTLNNSSATSEE